MRTNIYCRLLRLVCIVFVVCACPEQLSMRTFPVVSQASASESPSTATLVREWLDEQPQQARGEPPNEGINNLRLAWIERGKRIPSVEDGLIDILKDKTSRHRSVAALVIGRVGSAKALDALEMVFGTNDARLQLNAIESIRVISDSKRVDVLAAALRSTYRESETPDTNVPTNQAIVRANIVLALYEIDEDSARKLLKSVLSVETDPYVLDIVKRRKEAP